MSEPQGECIRITTATGFFMVGREERETESVREEGEGEKERGRVERRVQRQVNRSTPGTACLQIV